MAFLSCPQCGRLTSTDRLFCLECDVRLPQDFGILLEPNLHTNQDAMLRTTLLQSGTHAAIQLWLAINPDGGLEEAKAHVKRLKDALLPGQHPPAE